MSQDIILIAHNLRSSHNVGSLLRTAEGLGVSKIYLTGYTPYPIAKNDERLPHEAAKTQKQIEKTALGAAKNISWEHAADIFPVLQRLKKQNYTVAALEQTDSALDITRWQAPNRLAIIVGRETEGIEADVLQECDLAVQIPMLGRKESFNVAQAAAMALFHCRFS